MVETQISQNNISGVSDALRFLFHSFLLKKKKFLMLATTELISCPISWWSRLRYAIHCNPFCLFEAG